MKKVKVIFMGIVVLMLSGFGSTVNAQNTAKSAMMHDSKNMMKTAMRLETQTDWFKESLAMAFDNNRVDGTETEDEVMTLVKGFELATDRYKDRVDDNEVIPSDVERLLSRAIMIEERVSKLPASAAATRDWMMIKQTLDDIAKSNNVAWVWTLTANPFWKTAAVEPIYDRLEMRSDEFYNSFRHGIDSSKLNGTKLEDEAIQLVGRFEENLDMLEQRVDKAGPITSVEMDKVMQQGMLIEAFMRTHTISPRARRDWRQVKASMRELAMRSNVAWSWDVRPVATK